jgi:hypothetical protein
MKRLNLWAIGLTVSSVLTFGLLSHTVLHFDDGRLHIQFEGPGGIRGNASVEKNEKTPLPEINQEESQGDEQCIDSSY